MKNIIFIAPPASGKGTQSNLLVKKYGYNHISTGNLLSSEVASESKLGKEIAEIINSGNFVSNDIVTSLLENKLIETKEPYAFDGYPRNLEQAKSLDELLNKLNIKPCLAIYLNVSEEEAIRRVVGRLKCPNCNRTYNKFAKELQPELEGICDDCNIELVNREDDTEETFKIRYKNYIKNTIPLLNYYKNKEMLYIVEDPVNPTMTLEEIENVIK